MKLTFLATRTMIQGFFSVLALIETGHNLDLHSTAVTKKSQAVTGHAPS